MVKIHLRLMNEGVGLKSVVGVCCEFEITTDTLKRTCFLEYLSVSLNNLKHKCFQKKDETFESESRRRNISTNGSCLQDGERPTQ